MPNIQGEPDAQGIERECPEAAKGSSVLVDSISLRSVFNEAVEPHLFFTVDGQLLDVNSAGCLYLGITKEELLDLNIYDFIVSEDRAILREVLGGIHEVGAGILDVHFNVKRVGLLTAEMAYQLVEHGEEGIIYARIHDRQVMRILGRLLEQQEKSFKSAERVANFGFWEFYPKEGVIEWSDETFNIFGLPITAQAPSFEEFMARIHPNDIESVGQTIQHALSKGESYVVKHRIIRTDGVVRWCYGRGEVLLDEGGSVEKIYGTVQDITEEESIREAMRKSEQRIRFHIDGSPLGYIEWDAKFEVVEWNQAAERIFGFTKAEAIAGKANIIPEQEAERINQIVAEILSDKGGTHSINTNLTKSGKRITVEWFNTTLKGENNEIVGIGSIVQDITQRINAKRQLESYAHDLEVAKEKAESAVRAKGDFLANMSHEIRTPMNGVIGMASILLDTELNEEQQDYVETIVQSGESLLAIINDILNLSKVEAGKMDLEFVPFNIREVLENTCDLLAAKTAKKQLELILFVSQDVPAEVLGDPTRVQQVLLNLIGNAIKFTDSGYVEVRLEVTEVFEGAVTLAFHVTDTGIGIPQEKLDRLFNAFTQVDASTTRKYGGTGLGLAISAQLAQLMNGDISVDSEEGVGSTFTFLLVVEKEESGNIQEYDIGGMNVLLAEPNVKVQHMIGALLDELQCCWTAVTSMKEMLNVLNSDNEIETLLLASSLGNDSGVELVEQVLKEVKDRPRVILLTSIVDRTEYKGVEARLAKPVHLKGLYRTLKKVGILQE